MTIRVRKVGYISESEIIFVGKNPGDFASVLTNIKANAEADGPEWGLSVEIGEGATKRAVKVQLAHFMTEKHYEHSKREPVKLVDGDKIHFVLFKDRFFVPESNLMKHEHEEMILRVKAAVYKEEEEINSLKSYVSNMEAATAYRKNEQNRIPIPDDVKLAVWARDNGACIRCGSKEKLHFDHVIPVAKGGGNDLQNIQILCAQCNLKKYDKIVP